MFVTLDGRRPDKKAEYDVYCDLLKMVWHLKPMYNKQQPTGSGPFSCVYSGCGDSRYLTGQLRRS